MQFLKVMDIDEATKAALKGALKLSSLTFPAIFIRGVFLGGLEQLQDAASTGQLVQMLRAERPPFTGVFNIAADPVRLLTGPSRQQCSAFQMTVYTNYIRAISAVHVAIFSISIAASHFSWAPWVPQAAYWCMIVDLVIFVASGPTPIAPISTIVTICIWRSRGNAANSLPYKLVFTVYALAICHGVVSKGSISVHTTTAFLINSLFLAVLRF